MEKEQLRIPVGREKKGVRDGLISQFSMPRMDFYAVTENHIAVEK